MGFFTQVLLVVTCVVFASSTSIPVTHKIFKQPARDSEVAEWWQNAVIYQIYPRSFKDSNNDGSGDLQGIIQKLDYIQDTGIDAIWLSPIYKSPQVDNGYDISDYRDIDEIYGTLDDLRQLVDEAHNRGIKVILDYVPNHTSDQHPWFQSSVKKESGFEDFYVWKDAVEVDGQRTPPNNWLSAFQGSAWEWNEERQQYYLHQFSTGQPDLNYRNPDVVKEMKDVVLYWLNFGIDGFRVDAVPSIFEDSQFRDEPLSGDPDAEPGDYNYLKHIYTSNLDDTFELVYEFREFIDEFNQANNSYPRIIITEAYADIDNTVMYYGSFDGRPGAHFTFNFWTFILGLEKGFGPFDIFGSIDNWVRSLPYEYTNNWVLGNHDQPRVSSRLGVENVDALNMFAAILPGVFITYNGEEIGQENGEVTCDEGYDPQAIKNCTTFDQRSRDFERTPFQWNSDVNAGFNDGAKPWLPVSQKYQETNLKDQSVEGINSHYNIYKELLQLRQAFRNETGYDFKTTATGIFFSYTRFLFTSNVVYNFVYNVGDEERTLPDGFAATGATVVVRNGVSEYEIGDIFDAKKPMKSNEAVILKYIQ